jgi:hypothetical protein
MAKRLPSNVYHSRRKGGFWWSWNGRPEGSVHVTFSRAIAYGAERDDDGQEWGGTPFQGAHGACYPSRIAALVADYIDA